MAAAALKAVPVVSEARSALAAAISEREHRRAHMDEVGAALKHVRDADDATSSAYWNAEKALADLRERALADFTIEPAHIRAAEKALADADEARKLALERLGHHEARLSDAQVSLEHGEARVLNAARKVVVDEMLQTISERTSQWLATFGRTVAEYQFVADCLHDAGGYHLDDLRHPSFDDRNAVRSLAETFPDRMKDGDARLKAWRDALTIDADARLPEIAR